MTVPWPRDSFAGARFGHRYNWLNAFAPTSHPQADRLAPLIGPIIDYSDRCNEALSLACRADELTLNCH